MSPSWFVLCLIFSRRRDPADDESLNAGYHEWIESGETFLLCPRRGDAIVLTVLPNDRPPAAAWFPHARQVGECTGFFMSTVARN